MVTFRDNLDTLTEVFVKMVDEPGKYETIDAPENWGRYRWAMLDMILNSAPKAFHKLNNWRQTMARRTFTIELKIDLENEDDRYEPMKRIVKQFARDLMASSVLLSSSNKPPEVVAFTEDAFFTTEELKIDQLEGEEEVTPEVTAGA